MQNKRFFFSTRSSISKKSRHWRRILSLLLLPCYGLIGWLRLVESINLWDYLVELNLWPRPLYFAITGGLIGTCFTLAWFFSLFKLGVGWTFNRIIGIVFLLWFWIDRIWFSTREAFFNQLVIALVITGITFLWITALTPRPNQTPKEISLEP